MKSIFTLLFILATALNGNASKPSEPLSAEQVEQIVHDVKQLGQLPELTQAEAEQMQHLGDAGFLDEIIQKAKPEEQHLAAGCRCGGGPVWAFCYFQPVYLCDGSLGCTVICN